MFAGFLAGLAFVALGIVAGPGLVGGAVGALIGSVFFVSLGPPIAAVIGAVAGVLVACYYNDDEAAAADIARCILGLASGAAGAYFGVLVSYWIFAHVASLGGAFLALGGGIAAGALSGGVAHACVFLLGMLLKDAVSGR